jgi:hypothetical protein
MNPTVAFLIAGLHWLCGLIVLSEALNKIERTDIFDGRHGALARLAGLAWLLTPWRWTCPRVVIALKLLAWAALAVGGAGALVTPFLHFEPPGVRDLAVIGGFALLIVRSRLKECMP